MKKQSFLEQVFKFLSSMKLAVVILVLLMGVLAAGTIIESLYGADAARVLIYRTLWFQIILLFLGVNVLGAALDRLPWKKKHTGFVITHAGILLILAGSLVTQYFMIDGNIVLEEGETGAHITLSEPILYVLTEHGNRDWVLEVPPKGLAWEGREKMQSLAITQEQSADFSLLSYYPKAEAEEIIVSAETGPAAVEVALKGSMAQGSQWLVENDAVRGEMDFGVAKLKFSDRFLNETVPESDKKNYLEFEFSEQKIRIPLDAEMKLPVTVALEGTPYQAELVQIYRHAAIIDNKLTERDEKNTDFPGSNPAVKFKLSGNGLEEWHTVFAHFPDFPTMHGMKPSQSGAKIFYRVPDGALAGAANELRFVRTADGLFYQVKTGDKIQSGKVETQKPINTGWMDIQAEVVRFYEHAKKEMSVRAVPDKTAGDNFSSAIQIEIASGNETVTRWLLQGREEIISVKGQTFHVAFGRKRIPAGFRLKLKDFRIQYYPGSERPKSYESDVTLIDDTRGATKDVTISMNEPLVWHGYRIYQSGYSVNSGEPEISIFSVGRDPGIPINYLGAIVMILGIVIMYYTNRYSTNAGRLNS